VFFEYGYNWFFNNQEEKMKTFVIVFMVMSILFGVIPIVVGFFV